MTRAGALVALLAVAGAWGWAVHTHDAAVLAGPTQTFTNYEEGRTMDRAGESPATRLREQLRRERVELRAARRDAARWRTAAKASPSVGEALTLASVVYGVSRSELSSVAWCESNHRPGVANGPYRGLFQQGPMFEATPFGQAGLSVWSPYAAALSTAYTVRQQGWRQWECKP